MKLKLTDWLIIIACFLVFIGWRLYPYLDNNVPLGYDPGLYLYGFKNFPFPNDWLKSMYPPGLFALVHLIPFNPTYLLIPLVLFFSALLFWAVFLLANRLWGKKAAFWAIFLLASSLVQYRVFYWYYLKNIAALAFLFLTFYCLLSKSYWAIFWGVLTVYFHSPTDFILYAALFSGLLFAKNHRPYYLLTLVLTCLFCLPRLSSYQPLVKSILTSFGEASGTFYEPAAWLVLSILYLPLGLLTFLKNYRKIPFLILPIFGLLLTTILRMFFYRRLIIYLDIFLLLFAALALSKIKNRLFLIIFVILNLIYLAFFVKRTAYPQINHDEFREIQTINLDGYLLATDEMNAPWLMGYSTVKQVITTGLNPADNYWTEAEWQRFWFGSLEDEINLLRTLPQPLYLYHSDRQPDLPFVNDSKCFEKVSWRVYRFKCK
ncbi:MAG TPA: hypothetical protein P5299_00595 [Candidatus Woesebacteria bacterium]|nr:hypothetical protein [Candidatus Woesebacteria bacterium]